MDRKKVQEGRERELIKGGERVIFLDRDGTLNEEVSYLHAAKDMRLLPGVREAVGKFNRAGYLVVVVTNQAGVARGYYTEEEVVLLHTFMNEEFQKAGAKIDYFYYCPHHPVHGIGSYKTDCHCRKPETGMFMQAEKEIGGIDKTHSYMIGDKLIDTQAGKRFGVTSILVGTGYGAELRQKQEKDGLIGKDGTCLDKSYDYYAEDLSSAAELILNGRIDQKDELYSEAGGP